MKKISKLRRGFFLITLSCLLIACSSALQTGIKDVRLEMSKKEVIRKLGDDYRVFSIYETEKGTMEVVRYTEYAIRDGVNRPVFYYDVYFLNEKLVEIGSEEANSFPRPPHHKVR